MSSVFHLIITLLFLLVGHIFVNATLYRSLNSNDSNQKDSWKDCFLLTLTQLRFSLTRGIDATNAFSLLITGALVSLFWGWSPALLTIVICHLIVVNSLSVMAGFKQNEASTSVLKNFYPSIQKVNNNHKLRSNRQFYAWLIMYGFCALCMAILTCLSADILSLESGTLILVFSIALAAYASININPPALAYGAALTIILIGTTLSNHLGIFIMGTWQPFASIETIHINESWVFAATLVTMAYIIRGQLLKATVAASTNSLVHLWYQRLCSISKFFNLSLIFAIFVFFIIKRPVIDAPMHAYSDTLPTYIKIIAIVLFFAVGNLIDLLNDLLNSNPQTTNKHSNTHNTGNQNSLSSYSLISAVCGIILLFLFSSSVGIGAWQTHFLVWSPDTSLFEYLSKAIDSISGVLTFYGFGEVAAKNLVSSCILLNICIILIKLMRLNEQCFGILHSITNTRFRARSNNCLFISVLVIALLIVGVNINTWVLLGVISLCSTLIIAVDLLHSFLNKDKSHPFIWLGIALLGCIFLLAIPQIIAWYNTSVILALIASAAIIACAFVVSEKTLSIFLRYWQLRSQQEINLDDDD